MVVLSAQPWWESKTNILIVLIVLLDFPSSTARKESACQCSLLQEMQETWVWSLGWEDPLEQGMATHSSTLAWEIPWTEEPGGLQSMGSQTPLSTLIHSSIASPPAFVTFLGTVRSLDAKWTRYVTLIHGWVLAWEVNEYPGCWREGACSLP